MSNVILSMCYGKSQIAALMTKHINMNESIHDKIAHQQLKNPITHSRRHHKDTEENLDKNIGSGS